MGKNKEKIKSACVVFQRPKKKNKWGVLNRITNSEFLFKKKRHAYLVAECLNQIYKIEEVDIPDGSD